MADPGFLPEIPTYVRQMPYPARNLPRVPGEGAGCFEDCDQSFQNLPKVQ